MSTAPNDNIVLCNTPRLVREGLAQIAGLNEITFDSEGDDLGRHGPMTLLQLSSTVPQSTVFIFDIQAVGDEIFTITTPDDRESLHSILESSKILKVTFDCRSDSDALYHQFNVKLSNVLDTQVFHQGVRRARKEYRGASKDGSRRAPYVQGMAKCAEYYLEEEECQTLGLQDEAPHKQDKRVWTRLPRQRVHLLYAASDCWTISRLLQEMRAVKVSPKMMKRVIKGSKKYVTAFRERTRAVTWPRDRNVFLIEQPI